MSDEQDDKRKGTLGESEASEKVVVIPPEGVSELPEEIQNQLPKGATVVTVESVQSIESYTGSCPPPSYISQLNEIDPSYADRMIAMSERQQQHRIETEASFAKASILDAEKERKQIGLGQFFGLVVSLAGIGCGTAVGICGETFGSAVIGSIIGGGGLVSLVAQFMMKKDKEDE